MDRTSPPLYLTQSPLVFVLAQVRFDPVLAVADFIPKIQEVFRKQGFPKLRTRETPSRLLHDDNQVIRVETKLQWEFHDVANQTAILLDHDSVAVLTTQYERYEEFEKLIQLALETTSGAMEFSQITRCGLRYIDAIDRPESRDWGELILPSLLGLPSGHGVARENSLSQTDLLTREGTSRLRVRCLTQQKGLVIPPELLPCALEFKRPPNRVEPFAILDFDHYTLSPFDFNRDTTLHCLAELHDILDQTFRTSVTETALSQWQ